MSASSGSYGLLEVTVPFNTTVGISSGTVVGGGAVLEVVIITETKEITLLMQK